MPLMYETVDKKARYKVEAPVDAELWTGVLSLCRMWKCTPADVVRKAVKALVQAHCGPERGVID